MFGTQHPSVLKCGVLTSLHSTLHLCLLKFWALFSWDLMLNTAYGDGAWWMVKTCSMTSQGETEQNYSGEFSCEMEKQVDITDTNTHQFIQWSEVAQLCPTLWDPLDCSLPGSSVHGIFQARILEWVAISFSRGTSRLRARTPVSLIVGRRFTVWATSVLSASFMPSTVFKSGYTKTDPSKLYRAEKLEQEPSQQKQKCDTAQFWKKNVTWNIDWKPSIFKGTVLHLCGPKCANVWAFASLIQSATKNNPYKCVKGFQSIMKLHFIHTWALRRMECKKWETDFH